MQEPRMLHSSVWLSNGAVFVIGGASDRDLNSVEMIKRPWGSPPTPQQYNWRYVAPMNISRRGTGCALFRMKIFVVGGRVGPSKASTDLACVEIYSLPSKRRNDPLGQWTVIRNMPEPMFKCHLINLLGNLYAIGKTDFSKSDLFKML